MKEILSHYAIYAGVIIAAILGGVVDYASQVQNKTKRWSFVGFVVHIVSATFFGMICGGIVSVFAIVNGWMLEDPVVIWPMLSSASGVGGFLGVRVADLITWKLLGAERRKS